MRTSLRYQNGSILVLSALLLPILLIIAGAAVDLGRIYLEKGRLQDAADDAVIVAGHVYAASNNNGDAARQAADKAAEKNINAPFQSSYNIKQSTLQQTDTYYQYCIEENFPLLFGSFLKMDTTNIAAAATAKLVPAPAFNKLIVAGAGPWNDASAWSDFVSHITDGYYYNLRRALEYTIPTPLNIFHMYNNWAPGSVTKITLDTLTPRSSLSGKLVGGSTFDGEIDYLDGLAAPFIEPFFLEEYKDYVYDSQGKRNYPIAKASLNQDYEQLERYINTAVKDHPAEEWNPSLLSPDRWLLHFGGIGNITSGNPFLRRQTIVFDGVDGGSTDITIGEDGAASSTAQTIIIARKGDIHLSLRGAYIGSIELYRPQFHGILYAPNGTVTLEGFHADFYGSLVGTDVIVDTRACHLYHEAIRPDTAVSLVDSNDFGR